MPTVVPTLTDAPTSPDRADRTTFTARAIARDNWLKNQNVPEMRTVLANVYANAVEVYNNAVATASDRVQTGLDRTAAAASALTAVNAPGTSGTSTTSLTIGTRTQTFVTQTGKAWIVGQPVMIASTASPTNLMHGIITAYNTGTGSMSVSVLITGGSGTLAAWTISLSGPNFGFPDQSSLQPAALTLPVIRPSLNLDFANSKTLDPRITFTRASTGTYWDGLSVALAEQNLVPYSQAFDQTSGGWGSPSGATVTGNVIAGPDGTITADLMTEDVSTGTHRLVKDISVISPTNVTLTWSVYAKPNGRNWFYIDSSVDGGNKLTYFDVQNGVVGVTAAGFTAAIASVGGGWYRCSVTGNSGSTGSGRYFQIGPASADNTNSYLGNGTSGVYLWGAQLEQRSSVTAYNATTTPITNYVPVLKTAAAGVARFNHNPATGESLGLLIEEQRTNLFTYSEEFLNWNVDGSVITSNVVIAPNGLLVADTIGIGTGNNRTFQFDNSGVTGSHVFSIFVKTQLGASLQIGFNGGISPGVVATINTDTGAVTGFSSATSSLAGNGWFRIFFPINISSAAGNSSYITIVAPGLAVAIWGAQLETGSCATSYIPTVAAQVTRAADSASMTGANFSSWYRTDEGAMYAEGTFANSETTVDSSFSAVSDGSSSNFLLLNNYGTRSQAVVQSGGASVANFVTATGIIPSNTAIKVAVSYKANDFAGATAGGNFQTDSSGAVPIGANVLYLGANQTNSAKANGTIKKLAYYPKRLSNVELQALTV